MNRRNRGFSRKMNWKHANRKHTIVRNIMGGDWYDNLHQYSKNKIHCSCWMCNPRKPWGGGANSISCNTIANQRKLQAMRRDMDEMDDEYEDDAG